MPEPYITHAMMSAFEDELEKRAFLGSAAGRLGGALLPRLGALLPRLGGRAAGQEASQLMTQVGSRAAGAGAGLGLGAAGGGVVGAGVGGYQGYQEDREQGGSGIGGALSGAAGGVGKGMATGAAIGAGLGASRGRVGQAIERVAGGASGGVSPAALARFGQRQLHGMTGLVPGGAPRLLPNGQLNPAYEAAMERMRMGVVTMPRDRLSAAQAAVQAGKPGAAEELAQAAAGKAVAQESMEKGLTNLPGMARALAQKGGVQDVWRLGVKPQWTQQGRMGKSMILLPAAGVATEAVTPDGEDGRGRGQRIGEALGTGTSFAATPFMPVVAQEALSSGARRVGGTVGKGIDRLVGAVRGPQEPPLGHNPGPPIQTSGLNEPRVEREYTDRALGKTPDMGFGGL